jgi:ribokinase
MLAVIGSPSFLPGLTPDAAGGAGGLAAGVARAAAAAGAEVQLVGKVGEDPAGDAVLISLARGGVGHLALLRDAGSATPMLRPDPTEVDPGETEPLAALVAGADAGDERASERGVRAARREARSSSEPGLPLEPADISLGLRYLRDFRVLVTADPLDEPSAAVVADAAAFAGAALVVIARGGQATTGAPAGAIVLEAPEDDPAGAFAALVGRFAASLDRGVDAAEAFRTSIVEGGWERSAG